MRVERCSWQRHHHPRAPYTLVCARDHPQVNASFVDTIKAGEPIATVLLTLLCLPGEKVTGLIFASLMPIVAGVAISSLSDTSFNLLGFCMAMGSNLCCASEAVDQGPSAAVAGRSTLWRGGARDICTRSSAV